MKRWSSLQRELYKIVDEKIDFQIHVAVDRMDLFNSLTRYWITVGDETVFDYPKKFVQKTESGKIVTNLGGQRLLYPYESDVPRISKLIREYIDTPKESVFHKKFERDLWNLTDILKAADRRNGKRRLEQLRERTDNSAALKIIELRCKKNEI